MSPRFPARVLRRPSPRSAHPGDRRRRLATFAGAAVALVAVAALIGSGAGTGGSRSSDQSSSGSAMSGDRVEVGGSSGGGSGSGAAPADAEGDAVAPTTVAAAAPTDGDAADEGSVAPPGAAGGAPVLAIGAPADAKIIRTGSLQVEVAKGAFSDGTAGLTRIATGLGGFVSASEISSFEDDPSGSITLRIPADQFDKAVAEIGDLGSVTALTTGSQDVTGEYTDLAARLKALTAERDQIELVLSRAESIPDILSVRDRLAVVQGEIEVAQGRQKVLDDQTSLSTLTVQLSEEGTPVTTVRPAAERSAWARLWHDSTDRFGDGGRAIALGLATMAPWLLLALVLWLPARWLWRRMTPVEAAEPTPPATVAD